MVVSIDEFDWDYYINMHSDLKPNGITTKERAFKHFNSFGKKEGRIVKISNIIFNLKEFVNKYKHILNLNGTFDDAFIKFMNLNHKNNIKKIDQFDWQNYLASNGDLVDNGIMNHKKAWNHWLTYGKKENRIIIIINQNKQLLINMKAKLNNMRTKQNKSIAVNNVITDLPSIDGIALKIREKLLFGEFQTTIDKLTFTPTNSIVPSKSVLYSEYNNDQAKIFFGILDRCKLEYYVFAGSAVGLSRNKQNIPWVDDYDIIVFKDKQTYFESRIVGLLRINGFECSISPWRNGLYHVISFRNIISGSVQSYFQADIFYTYVDRFGNIKNVAGAGRYHKHNIPLSYVKPAKRIKFNNITLPFFNKYEEDVAKEYGDVFNNCVIHIEHGRKAVKLPYHWTKVYDEFNYIKNTAINNTKNIIFSKNTTDYSKKITLDKNNKLNSWLETVTYVNNSNAGILYIDDQKYIPYVQAIKYYLPNIYIIYFMIEMPTHNLHSFFNYIDKVNFKNALMLHSYNNRDVLYVKKPKFKLLKS
jgi:hypothetical protein